MSNTREETKLLNETLLEKLSSGDFGQIKQANDAVTAFTRTTLREDGVYDRIIPQVQVSDSDLVRQVDTEHLVIIVDREPDSPGAISIPFGTLPQNWMITGDRYPVAFDRITTRRFTKDVDELRTWHMDIRQVISDNAIKDMLAEKDSKFLSAVDAALVGPGVPTMATGTVLWEQIRGGITRDTLWDALKVIPNTPFNLEAHTLLVNNITIKDLCKVDRSETSDSMSENIMKHGWTMENFMGKRVIVTIKKGLVPTGSMYMFADPAYIGKNFVLEDTTMYIRREAFMLEFFSYGTFGGAIGHIGGLGRVDFI